MSYNDCCPPSCYTFAFDGLSAVATHTTPPVLSCRECGWCDCSVYPDITSGYSLDWLDRNGTASVFLAKVLTAESLFSQQRNSIVWQNHQAPVCVCTRTRRFGCFCFTIFYYTTLQGYCQYLFRKNSYARLRAFFVLYVAQKELFFKAEKKNCATYSTATDTRKAGQ